MIIVETISCNKTINFRSIGQSNIDKEKHEAKKQSQFKSNLDFHAIRPFKLSRFSQMYPTKNVRTSSKSDISARKFEHESSNRCRLSA